MFIFTREREKECAGLYLHNNANVPLIHSVIDAAYDLADGTIATGAARNVLEDALINGGGGVWEQSGSWLIKLSGEFPSLDATWLTIARNSKATIRFRAAAHICDMSEPALSAVLPILLSDRSTKVRNKVVGDL